MDHGNLLTDLTGSLWRHAGGFRLIIKPAGVALVLGLPERLKQTGTAIALDYLPENEGHMHMEVTSWGVRAALSFDTIITRVEVPREAIGLVMAPDGFYSIQVPPLSRTSSSEVVEDEDAEPPAVADVLPFRRPTPK